MIRAVSFSAVLGVLVALVTDSAGASSDEIIFGVVKSVSSEPPAFRVKTRKGTVEVEWGSRMQIVEQKAKPLGEVKLGTHLFVLARYQEKAPTAGGGHYPPLFTGIVAIVAAPNYAYLPPPVPKALRDRGLKWHQGVLQRREKLLYVEEVQLPIGGERGVFFFKRSLTKDAVQRKHTVVIRGDKVEGKKKKFHANEVIVIAPQLKPKDYQAIIDPTGSHWPFPISGKKKKPVKGERPDF